MEGRASSGGEERGAPLPCTGGAGLARAGLVRAALLASAARRGRRATPGGAPRLWLLSDPARWPDPGAALPFLPAGSAVVLRGASPEVAARAARLCARRGLALLVGGDPRLALLLGAGLHLPERRGATPGLLRVLLARRAGRPAALSAAAHGAPALARARRLGAEALLSPAFPTASHPGAPALGPLRWSALARLSGGGGRGRGAVALGGVTLASVRRLPRCRLRGVAGIGFAVVARSPQCLKEVALRLARALPSARA